jgi:hypothetical protein
MMSIWDSFDVNTVFAQNYDCSFLNKIKKHHLNDTMETNRRPALDMLKKRLFSGGF